MFAHLIQFEVSDGLDLGLSDEGGLRYLGFEQVESTLGSVPQGFWRTSSRHFRGSAESPTMTGL